MSFANETRWGASTPSGARDRYLGRLIGRPMISSSPEMRGWVGGAKDYAESPVTARWGKPPVRACVANSSAVAIAAERHLNGNGRPVNHFETEGQQANLAGQHLSCGWLLCG